MTPRFAKVVGALCAAALTASASANSGNAFTWSFQQTSLSANSNTQIVAAMRNGLAWPVVINNEFATFGGGYGNSATLFATGGTTGTSGGAAGHWQNIGSGFFPTSSARLRAASSPDGRVAFAASDFSGVGVGGRVSSISGGWGALPAGTRAVSFDAAGNLYTATNTTVSGVGGYTGPTIIDMAVSPFGEVGVVSIDQKFWQYSAWLGAWTSVTLPSAGTTPSSDSYDLEYDSFGRPHVVATVGSSLVAWDFSTVSASWSVTSLVSFPGTAPRATLAANNDGTVGTAWVDPAGTLVYAYKHDLDPWATSLVINTGSPSTSSFGQVGITYDYADLPVLAYRTSASSPNLWVAYDPIVVPEPATGLMLAGIITCTLASRRRRND